MIFWSFNLNSTIAYLSCLINLETTLRLFDNEGIVVIKLYNPILGPWFKIYNIFSDNLYKTIYVKYYRGLKMPESSKDTLKKVKKILKESIIKMFNQGNFTFEEIDKGYFRKHIQR